MEGYTYMLEITTIDGIADSAYLDRLAEIVYGLATFVDPYLALEPTGAVSASFSVEGPNPLAAAQSAVQEFADAVAAAGPLRLPTWAEAAAAATLGRFAVTRAEDRERVYA